MPQAFTLWLSGASRERSAAVAERVQTELKSYEVSAELLLPSRVEDILSSAPTAAAELAAYLATVLNHHGICLVAALSQPPGCVVRPLPENLLDVRLVEVTSGAAPAASPAQELVGHKAHTVSLGAPSAELRQILGLLRERGWIGDQPKYAYSPEEEAQVADMLDQLGYL